MALRDNWARHLLASVNGESFRDSLARDFWRADEDLWAGEPVVTWRWFKLLFVYFASGLLQLVVPVAIVGPLIILFTGNAWYWLLVGMLIACAAVVLGAVLGATWSCLDIARGKRTHS